MEDILRFCENKEWDNLRSYFMSADLLISRKVVCDIATEGILIDEPLMKLIDVFNDTVSTYNKIDALYASLHHSSHECFKTEMARPGICSMQSEISYMLGKVITSCPRRISEAVAVVSDIFGKEELYAYYYAIRISDSRVIISELEGKCDMLEVRRILKEKYNTDLRDDI